MKEKFSEVVLSLRKFSYGFAVLKFFTIFLVLVFSCALAVRFKVIDINFAFLIVLFSLFLAYFMLPKMAQGIYRSLKVF